MLEAPQHALVEALLGGRTFGDVLRELTERGETRGSGTVAASVEAWFAGWARAGLIVRCDLT